MAKYKSPLAQTALYGLAPFVAMQADAVLALQAQQVAETLTSPKGDVTRATGFLEQHSPLFAPTTANPNRHLFREEN